MVHPMARQSNNSDCKIFCGAATVATVFVASTITLLVVGILGMSGAVHMAPSAGEWMFSIGAVIVLSMVTGVAKFCCCKN